MAMASSASSSSKASSIIIFVAVNLLLLFISSAVVGADTCPYDVHNLNACSNLVLYMDNPADGDQPPSEPCCSVVNGVAAAAEAAACVCAAFQTGVLVIDRLDNTSLFVASLLKECGKDVPAGYHCNA